MRAISVRRASEVDPDRMRAFFSGARERAAARYPFLGQTGPGFGAEAPMLSAALDANGTILGTMGAAFRESADWGDSAESGPWELALAPGADARDTVRSLYAGAFRSAPETALRHVVYADAAERDALEALVSLGFGIEQVYASRRLPVSDSAAPTAIPAHTPADARGAMPPGISLRPLGAENGDDMAGLYDLIIKEHAAGPVWAGLPPAYEAAVKKGFSDMRSDADAFCLIAYEGTDPVGYQCWFPEAATVAELSVGAVVPSRRGRGIGTALFGACVSELASRGFETAITDWRSANLSSGAFWPRVGFVPYMYRLARRFHPYQIRDSQNRRTGELT